MSHFTIVKLALTDRDALIEALEAMGYRGKIEVHEGPAALIGYDGLPRQLNDQTVTAEVVIRRKHLWSAANDIGFARQPDGSYLAYISEYDRQVQPHWPTRLLQEFGAAKAAKELRRKGWKVEITRQPGGHIRVQGVRYA